jgi:large subunit ribosomal protein L21
MYALVEFLGKQFKVTPGSNIKVPFINGEIGEKVTLNNVLYYDSGSEKVLGKPFIDNMSVSSEIVKQGRDRKIIVFKFKRRKGYQRKQGHRQAYTLIKVNNLNTKKSKN